MGSNKYIFQAINVPQLHRSQGWLLYLLSTGPFSLHNARGAITNERVVELRQARMAGLTGGIDSYNSLASLLPQDTKVFYYRCIFILVLLQKVPHSCLSFQAD